jgi:hypothetical protein
MALNNEAIGREPLAATRALFGPQGLALLALALAPLFWAAWQIKPLYSENQNTKFLHALADAGVGFLREDWLARTKDGLPAFTFLSEAIFRGLGPNGFYLAGLGTYALYLFCALVIFRRLTASRRLPSHMLAVFLATLFFFAAITDLHETFLGGFSEQYILSGYFQTADFGVFLICAILLFEKDHVPAALACLLLAGLMHAAYVVPAAVLTAIFLLHGLGPGKADRAAGWPWLRWALFALTLAALASISMMLNLRFTPTDPQSHLEAHRVITGMRIPRHADPWQWIDIRVFIQFAICIMAAWLLPPGRLRFVIGWATVALAVFTLAAFLPNTETYRLIAPWRLSVAIVPVAAIALCAMGLVRLGRGDFLPASRARATVAVSVAAMLICAVTGAVLSYAKHAKTQFPYLDFVRANLASGQLYLTATDLMDFRLSTGVPQYVSYKTHPYQDVEVLEWSRRYKIADELYRGKSMDCERLRHLATAESVTHVLVRRGDPALACDFAVQIFEGGGDRIFRLNRP